jgi:hypothetical protein
MKLITQKATAKAAAIIVIRFDKKFFMASYQSTVTSLEQVFVRSSQT